MSEHTSSGYVCPYCRLNSDASGPACPNCGAPTHVSELRNDEGWVEQPPISDMARIQFGRSQCQITGNYVPVAEMSLALATRSTSPTTCCCGPTLRRGSPRGRWPRAGTGARPDAADHDGGDRPGHIAFSADEAGELIAVPIEAGQAIEVAEHHFLVASSTVSYDWLNTRTWWSLGKGDEREFFYPHGRYVDQFTAQQRGLLLLHAYGNVFIRDLRKDERIYLAPRAPCSTRTRRCS